MRYYAEQHVQQAAAGAACTGVCTKHPKYKPRRYRMPQCPVCEQVWHKRYPGVGVATKPANEEE